MVILIAMSLATGLVSVSSLIQEASSVLTNWSSNWRRCPLASKGEHKLEVTKGKLLHLIHKSILI